MLNFNRIRTKYHWVQAVSRQIHHGPLSRGFLWLNGITNLATDPLGLGLPLRIPIALKGQRFSWPFKHILDYGLAYELWVKPSYAMEHPEPSGVKHIIDIGTNNGMSALYFRSRFPHATIHCVEPNATCARQIHSMSDVIQNVHIHQKAVSNTDSSMEFFVDPKSSVSSSILKRNHRQKAHRVDSIRLSTLLDHLAGASVDILKFDVEGAEHLIFDGSVDYSIIKTLIGELHYDLCDAHAVKNELYRHYSYVYEAELAENRTLLLATSNPEVRFI